LSAKFAKPVSSAETCETWVTVADSPFPPAGRYKRRLIENVGRNPLQEVLLRQSGYRRTVAGLSCFSYTAPMTRPLLSPGSADALLFDLGRVVLDIDFNKTLASWAGHAGCEPAQLVQRFSTRDAIYHRHETGAISDAEFFASLRASLGIGISDAQFLEGWNAIFAGEMPGIAPLLARAAQRLPLYAFSNTNGAHVEHFSQTYADVLGHFREIFLSSSIGLRKPDVEAFDHVVKAIGVPAERIVFFDDLAENVDGARARGLAAVHVTSSNDVAGALAALGI
jgi:FMN phosphatase YigB (HAD superfamily)